MQGELWRARIFNTKACRLRPTLLLPPPSAPSASTLLFLSLHRLHSQENCGDTWPRGAAPAAYCWTCPSSSAAPPSRPLRQTGEDRDLGLYPACSARPLPTTHSRIKHTHRPPLQSLLLVLFGLCTMFELYLITFNCARNLVSPEALAPGLFNALPKTAAVPDVVAISLQELAPIAYSFLGGSYLKPYFDRINTAVHLAVDLRSSGTEHLQHVATRSLGMTALAIFAKPQFAERIQWAQSAGAGVGFWDMGNKGAVAMRLGVACPGSDETLNLTFTAAHLAPMECNIEARNKDWENLVRNLVFVSDDDSGYSSIEDAPLLSSASSPRPRDEHNGIFASGNHVFFAGDLNYRTHDTPPGPNAYKSYPQPNASESSPAHYSHFLDKDQLTRERKANRTLHNFDELPIRFLPTYKLSISKDATEGPISEDSKSWKWAKHRYPSWCDRILFLHSNSSRFEPQVYTVLPIQPTSDHRPVALSVRLEEEPLSQDAVDMLHPNPPFPINPHWRTRRDVARRWEVTVGVLSYLALTRKGNAIVVAIAGVLFGSLWVAAWLGH